MKTSNQDRTVTIGEYTFNEKEHLHMLEGKPLTGVTTILQVIGKPNLYQWYANMACDHIEENCENILDTTKDLQEILHYLVTPEQLKEARKAAKRKMEAAGEWGTKTHSHVENVINFWIHENDGYATEFACDASIKLFVNWAISNKVKFLSSEKHLYSRKWWVGGIADIICEIDGKRYIGDIKTSSGIYPEHFVQCSAYAKMAEEMGLYEGKRTEMSCKAWGCENQFCGLKHYTLPAPAFDGVIIINLKKDGGFDTRTFMDIEQGAKVFESAVTIYRFKEAVK